MPISPSPPLMPRHPLFLYKLPTVIAKPKPFYRPAAATA